MADLASLVAAEFAFANSSPQLGTRGAFLAYLADDAILFRPRPVRGKEWTTAQPARPGLLTWYPMVALIARAGDLGYTTGPWEFRRNGPGDAPIAHGFFNSLWRVQASGEWKVELDCGISCPPPTAPIRVRALQPAKVSNPIEEMEAAQIDLAALQAELLALDRAGVEDDYADAARLYREDQWPYIGAAAIRSALAARSGLSNCQPVEARLARSGDLGYTYGLARLPPGGEATEACYLRLWQQQADRWLIVAEVENPLLPAS